MLIELFKKKKKEKPLYLDRIDELAKVSIVRLQGVIDQNVVPKIDSRIEENRKRGSKIDKNVLLDFAKVVDVDSSTIAFHLLRLKEYQSKGFKVGFINVNEEFLILVDLFHEKESFKIYPSEAEALKELG